MFFYCAYEHNYFCFGLLSVQYLIAHIFVSIEAFVLQPLSLWMMRLAPLLETAGAAERLYIFLAARII